MLDSVNKTEVASFYISLSSRDAFKQRDTFLAQNYFFHFCRSRKFLLNFIWKFLYIILGVPKNNKYQFWYFGKTVPLIYRKLTEFEKRKFWLKFCCIISFFNIEQFHWKDIVKLYIFWSLGNLFFYKDTRYLSFVFSVFQLYFYWFNLLLLLLLVVLLYLACYMY